MSNFLEKLELFGFVKITGLSPELSTSKTLQKLGISNLNLENIKQSKLWPLPEVKSSSNHYSGNFGLHKFPLHTDLAHWFLPPKFIVLRCVVPDPDTFTTLLNFENLKKTIKEEVIRKATFRPRKKIDKKMSLLRFRQKVEDEYLYRWDSLFLKGTNEEAEKVSENILSVDKDLVVNLKMSNAGDMIIINNWNVLHGRSEVLNGENKRLIERIYLKEV